MEAVIISNQSNRQIIADPPANYDALVSLASQLIPEAHELYWTEQGSEDRYIVCNDQTYEFAKQTGEILKLFAKEDYEPTHTFAKSKEIRTLLLGLDGCGKTTMLYKLKLGEVVTTIPTIGFNVESLIISGYNVTFWDVGGQPTIRPLWRHYYANTQLIGFVVDGTDPSRLEEAKSVLHDIASDQNIQNAPILILVNKYDLAEAIPLAEVIARLDLPSMWNSSRLIHVAPVSGLNGTGWAEAISYILSLN